jgi:hypothetical protein
VVDLQDESSKTENTGQASAGKGGHLAGTGGGDGGSRGGGQLGRGSSGAGRLGSGVVAAICNVRTRPRCTT